MFNYKFIVLVCQEVYIEFMYNQDVILKQFGLNVKAERIRKGLTQEQFAEKIGVERVYISKIERGLQNMSLKKIIELTNHLNADIKNILNF